MSSNAPPLPYRSCRLHTGRCGPWAFECLLANHANNVSYLIATDSWDIFALRARSTGPFVFFTDPSAAPALFLTCFPALAFYNLSFAFFVVRDTGWNFFFLLGPLGFFCFLRAFSLGRHFFFNFKIFVSFTNCDEGIAKNALFYFKISK